MENTTYSNLWYDDIRASYSGATLCGWVRPVLYIGLEQRRPTNPIGGDSKKSQGIGCWSTVNSLQSGLPQHNQFFFPWKLSLRAIYSCFGTNIWLRSYIQHESDFFRVWLLTHWKFLIDGGWGLFTNIK